MVTTNALNTVKAAGCCDALYNVTASGVNWLGRNAKAVGNGAWSGVKNVASAVSTFFAEAGKKIGTYLGAAIGFVATALTKAKAGLVALPAEGKAAVFAGVALAALTTFVACRCVNKSEVAPASSVVAANAANSTAPDATTLASAPVDSSAAPDQTAVATASAEGQAVATSSSSSSSSSATA